MPITTAFELYSTQGEPVDGTPEAPATLDQSIRGYFDSHVQVAIEPSADGDGVTVTSEVRARPSKYSRFESYYVRFEFVPDDDATTVRRDLRRFLTRRAGLTLADREEGGAAPVHDIWSVTPRHRLDDDTLADLDRFLDETGESVEITVPDNRAGLEVGLALLSDTVAESVVLTSTDRHRLTGDFDLVIRTGHGGDVELTRETAERVAARREQWTAERVDEHLDTIRAEVRALERETDLDEAAVRRRVLETLPSVGPAERLRVVVGRPLGGWRPGDDGSPGDPRWSDGVTSVGGRHTSEDGASSENSSSSNVSRLATVALLVLGLAVPVVSLRVADFLPGRPWTWIPSELPSVPARVTIPASAFPPMVWLGLGVGVGLLGLGLLAIRRYSRDANDAGPPSERL